MSYFRVPVLASVVLSIAAAGIPIGGAINTVAGDPTKTGGGIDASADCDVLVTSCAAAAAIAISVCVSAKIEGTAEFYGQLLFFVPISGSAPVSGEVTACQSFAAVVVIAGVQYIPGEVVMTVMAGTGCLGPPWMGCISDRQNDTKHETVPPLRHALVGPFGTEYSIAQKLCVVASGRVSVNGGVLSTGVQGFGSPFGAVAAARANSADCGGGSTPVLSEGERTFRAPHAALPAEVAAVLGEQLDGALQSELESQAASWEAGPLTEELLADLKSRLRSAVARDLPQGEVTVRLMDSGAEESP